MTLFCHNERCRAVFYFHVTALFSRPVWLWLTLSLTVLHLSLVNGELPPVPHHSGRAGALIPPESDSNAAIVSILWGLPDAAAVTGKLFRYHLPSDAFQGPVKSYKVKDATGDILPGWLAWDPDNLEIFGVPKRDDAGPHYISVAAIGPVLNQTHVSVAEDVFTVHVREESHVSSSPGSRLVEKSGKKPDSPELHSCAAGEPILLHTVSLPTSLNELSPTGARALLEQSSKLFNHTVAQLRLYECDYVQSLEQQVLMVGPGNAASDGTCGAIIAWRIGCGDQVPTALEPAVLSLEQQVASDQPTRVLGAPVAGWSILSVHISPRRRKRQWGGRITPTPSVVGGWRPVVTAAIRPQKASSTTTSTTTTTMATEEPETEAPATEAPATAAPPLFPPIVEPSTAPIPTEPMEPDETPELPQEVVTDKPEVIVPPAPKKPKDRAPALLNSLGVLYCTKGVLCTYAIPPYTFADPEDGDTSNLLLTLSSDVGAVESGWLMLRSMPRQTLIGMPMQVGTYDYRLMAEDSSGRLGADAFQVIVAEDERLMKGDRFNHVIRMVINMNYDRFIANASMPVELCSRLGRYMGDPDASSVLLSQVMKGSVIVEWSNASLSMEHCEKDKLEYMRNRLLKTGGGMRKRLRTYMNPPFEMGKVDILETGTCANAPPSMVNKDPAVVPPGGEGDSMMSTTPRSSDVSEPLAIDDPFVTTVVPIVVIVALLILAAVIALILVRKNRSMKQTGSPDRAGRNEYVSKGAPVIFPEEMGDEREPTATTPMLLKEEQPPLPVPDYTRGGRNGSTPPRGEPGEEMTERGPLLSSFNSSMGGGHTIVAQNPLYQPPPPVDTPRHNLGGAAASPHTDKGAHSRPKLASPHAREPPPYVPP